MELAEWLQIDPHAGRPLFDQIRTQIIDGVRAGPCRPGTRLPTVRELAGQLGLAVNTVARAYRELEAGGIVETRGRFGTFVASGDPADGDGGYGHAVRPRLPSLGRGAQGRSARPRRRSRCATSSAAFGARL